jgi:quercetin dioxygenase-like cupin family protein
MKLVAGEWEDKGAYRTADLYRFSESCFLQIVEIKPNTNVPKHYHKVQTEIFTILSGRAKLGIGEESYDAKPGDVFVCKPEDKHWVENESDEIFRILVFKYNWVEDDIYWD